MKTIAFALALFASFAAHAEWVYVNTSKDGQTKFFIKNDSFALTKTGGQVITKSESKEYNFFFIAQISSESCTNGFGEIDLYHTNKTHAFNHSYVKNGGTIVQFIGDAICHYVDTQNSQTRL